MDPLPTAETLAIENRAWVCDVCDGSGQDPETGDDCHLCEGAGWFDAGGFPLGDDD